MTLIEKIKTNSKRIITILSVLLSTTFLLCAFTGSANEVSADSQLVYRESPVTRGDIIVGVTETATATLKTHIVKSEYAAKIETIDVKAGQQVKAGDLIATLSHEELNTQLKDAKTEYQEAVLALNDAKLTQQKNQLSAQSTYKSSLSKSGTAEDTYNITIEKLELAVEKAKKSVSTIQKEIRTYSSLLNDIDDYDDDYTNYSDAKTYYEDTQEWAKSSQELFDAYKKEQGENYNEDDPESQRLLTNLENANAEMEYAKLDYEYAGEDFDDKYDTELTEEEDIEDARTAALDKLEDAEMVLKEAQYNLNLQLINAAETRDDTTATGEIAQTTYDMTIAQLENTVSSKSLKVQTAQAAITELNEALEVSELYAPCDGIVTTVSVSQGDQVQSNAAIVTVSDSSYGFVYVTIAQDDIADITMGQSATLVMDAFDSVNFEGVVDSITTTPARTATSTASYNVTIQIQGDTSKIFEGMTGSATLITRQQKDVLYVSNRTIYDKDGANYVKVKREDGTIEEIAVETGFSDGKNVEIVSGLEEGWIAVIESQVNTQS